MDSCSLNENILGSPPLSLSLSLSLSQRSPVYPPSSLPLTLLFFPLSLAFPLFPFLFLSIILYINYPQEVSCLSSAFPSFTSFTLPSFLSFVFLSPFFPFQTVRTLHLFPIYLQSSYRGLKSPSFLFSYTISYCLYFYMISFKLLLYTIQPYRIFCPLKDSGFPRGGLKIEFHEAFGSNSRGPGTYRRSRFVENSIYPPLIYHPAYQFTHPNLISYNTLKKG